MKIRRSRLLSGERPSHRVLTPVHAFGAGRRFARAAHSHSSAPVTMATTRHAIDRTFDLAVNGSRRRIRLCADREGQPPLLIVQGGPGLPVLNEVRKFQRLLDLERDFLVGYWEQ